MNDRGAMVTEQATTVLVHGFWHGSWCWTEVAARLVASGQRVVAVDMAGHGLRARRSARPLDPAAPSPVADVDLDQAGDLLVDQLRAVGGGAPVRVIAHSMAGTVLTRAAEQAPELVARAVYVTAFMPASGRSAASYIHSPENAGELVGRALPADPADVGSLRLDPASTDPDYQALLRATFYGDVDRTVADAAIALLSPDAPAGIAGGETTLTSSGWGSVPRTYVRCRQDMAIRPALQDRFIADADAAYPANPTVVHGLDASHSPFLSMPDQLAALLSA